MQPLPSQRKDRSRYISEFERDNKKREDFLSFFCIPHISEAIIIKRFVSLILFFSIFISCPIALYATDYDEEGAYWECYTLYPDFIDKIKECNVTDKQLLTFVKSVENEILKSSEQLTEENFDSIMFSAFQRAFKLRKNLIVRDALAKVYPASVSAAMDGVITDEFMPIYTTVKRFIFSVETPVVTLSEKNGSLSLHYVHMPDNARTFLSLYDENSNHLCTFINPCEPVDVTNINYSYAKAFAFDSYSLSPLCDFFTLSPQKRTTPF